VIVEDDQVRERERERETKTARIWRIAHGVWTGQFFYCFNAIATCNASLFYY